MINLKTLYSIILILCLNAYAQSPLDSLHVNFHLKFNREPLAFHHNYISSNSDTLSLEVFRCYISNIKIYYVDKSVFKLKDSYHLLDSDDAGSFRIPIAQKNNKPIAKIIFNLGIDSLTSTSGAMSGDLDPLKGMYWAWQSGYINMKLEGKSLSCKTRKNAFHFHIGGYLPPYYALRKIELVCDDKKTSQLDIAVDLDVFFSKIKLSETNSIMIPGKQAMQLSDLASKIFRLE